MISAASSSVPFVLRRHGGMRRGLFDHHRRAMLLVVRFHLLDQVVERIERKRSSRKTRRNVHKVCHLFLDRQAPKFMTPSWFGDRS